MSKYHLFWNGTFSQWCSSDFIYNGVNFTHAEQFMMYWKAIFFGDHEIAGMILDADSPDKQKKLGRKVKGFDIEKWAHVARDIVYIGNKCKYGQNLELCKELVSTYPKTLVEASPYDKIWGIGLSEFHPDAHDETKWRGKNWLGEVLTDLRNNIMKGDSSKSSVDNLMATLIIKNADIIKQSKTLRG